MTSRLRNALGIWHELDEDKKYDDFYDIELDREKKYDDFCQDVTTTSAKMATAIRPRL